MSTPAAPPDKKRLALATLAALGIALLVLVLFILPAEYGVDPTGIGSATGLSRLNGNAAPATNDPSAETPESVAPAVTIQTYESRFATTSTQILAEEGYLAEGDTLLLSFQLTQANITRVKARLEFSDQNATPNGQRTRPDTFEIELKAPHGDVSGGVIIRSEEATGGAMGETIYLVRQPPYPRQLEAASDSEARAAFEKNDPPDTTLTGEWLVRVSMIEAQDGDVQGATIPGLPGTAASDDGNNWKLTLTIETYQLDVNVKPGTAQRQDKVTLELPAGGELEYKLAMTLGKRLDYSWSTNGPSIYVDFHGEKTGDASGGFTRHKNGDFTADSGTILAPFDGRQGWFWRNTGAAPVTITLETRGQYDVVGKV